MYAGWNSIYHCSSTAVGMSPFMDAPRASQAAVMSRKRLGCEAVLPSRAKSSREETGVSKTRDALAYDSESDYNMASWRFTTAEGEPEATKQGTR